MSDGKELVPKEVPELKPIPVDKIVEYTEHVKDIAKRVMKEKHHYGVIPGTEKPTLLKPGAEILCVAFRLNPQYEILTSTERDDLILYNVRCVLVGIDSGKVVASGIGSCNSKEKKYRFIADIENTGKPVPKAYWKDRDQSLLGGLGYFAKKIEGEWVIVKKGDTVERKDAWDLVNTILKMAEKRALIAAVLNATAASDVFTQDLEDNQEDIIDVEAEVVEDEKRPTKGDLLIELYRIATEDIGMTDDVLIEKIRDDTGKEIGKTKEGKLKLSDLTVEEITGLITTFKSSLGEV